MTSTVPHKPDENLQIVCRHPDAIVPQQGSVGAAGYNLYSVDECTIPPQNVGVIDTGISTKFPATTYGRIASRSGLALNNYVEIKGGVIDPDYTGNIKVILHNYGSQDFHVKKKDRIAQLILEKYISPPVTDKKLSFKNPLLSFLGKIRDF